MLVFVLSSILRFTFNVFSVVTSEKTNKSVVNNLYNREKIMAEKNNLDSTIELEPVGSSISNNKSCDINVSNGSSVTIENVVAKYWKTNSIVGNIEGHKICIVDGITLLPNESSDVVKGIEYDTPPNPRNDHWSLEFQYAGETYSYRDKKCNITSSDANKLVTMKVTGSPKKGFTFHVEMPKSSSCSGHMS